MKNIKTFELYHKYRVGDYVEMNQEYFSADSEGKYTYGKITEIDENDIDVPYGIKFTDGGSLWSNVYMIVKILDKQKDSDIINDFDMKLSANDFKI